MHPDCYTVSLPYPTVRPCREDLRLARMIFPMYTGAAGELSAISNYLYAALRTEPEHDELCQIFDALARTEMHHFRLLGALLRDLGADPVIRTRIDAGRLNPEPTPQHGLRALFTQCLRSEQASADNYRYLMGQTDDDAVRDLLHRILLDEEAHLRFFQTMLN